MTAITPSLYEQMLAETAARYMLRPGYKVLIQPPSTELPDFLRAFHPDLLVTTPEGRHLVIEVQAKGKVRRVDYWESLRSTIASHPGWQLKLFVNSQREEELLNASQPLYSLEDAKDRLRVGQELAEQGYSDSAFLIVWAALETILRELSQSKDVNITNESPAALITTLTSEGELQDADYHSLHRLLRVRNQLVHGRQADDVTIAFAQLHEIATRLLHEQNSEDTNQQDGEEH